MGVDSLESLSLVCIRSNLYFISKICKRNAIFLPPKIGMSIFEFANKDNKPFSTNELKFFSSSILYLSNVTLKQRKFTSVDNLSFLSDHPIKSLCLENFIKQIYLPIVDTLKNLELKSCDVFAEESVNMFKQSANLPSLKSLNLNFSRNITRSKMVKKLIQFSSISLQAVDFSSCNFSKEDCYDWLGSVFQNCSQLREVNLSGNQKMGDGWLNILKGLKSSSNHLLKIDFSYCDLIKENNCWLGELFKICKLLQEVNLSGNKKLGDGWSEILAGLTSSSQSIIKIEFSNCFLSSSNGNMLGNFLKQCTSIEEINLSENKRILNGFDKICQGLKLSSNTLKRINYSDCNLNENQINFVSDLIADCTLLEQVVLCDNENFRNQAEKICSGLMSSSNSLQRVDVFNYNLNSEESYWFANLLQKCKTLREVYIFSHGMEEIFISLKSSSASLRKIKIEFFDVTDEEILCVGNLLEECKILEDFSISANMLSSKQLEVICAGLQPSLNSLKKIKFSPCIVEENDVYCPGSLFIGCESLTEIDLMGSHFNTPGLAEIFQVLKSSAKSLLKVNFNNCVWKEGDIGQLADLLRECTFIEEINLSSTSLHGNEFKNICEGLTSSSNSLLDIDLSCCDLNEDQSFWLGDFLNQCTSLQNIDLSANCECGKNIWEIFDGLKLSSYSLRKLYLFDCNLNEEQSCWLGDLLQMCTSIQEINLSGNNEFGKGFKGICNGLKSSSNSLIKIILSDNDLNEEQSHWLGDLLQDCLSIQEIDLSGNDSCGKEFKRICNGLKSSSNSLLNIRLSQCQLSSCDCRWLGDLLEKCTCLEELCLSFNENCSREFKGICQGLKASSHSLLRLNLSYCKFNENHSHLLIELLRNCNILEDMYLDSFGEDHPDFINLLDGFKAIYPHLNLSYL
ncbi:unnamed protein product [Dimorphilus gyrociliatus]|uniref:Uncharacterized protein n=1 Tax=Dimorphilus gyrociliatus TaxID=2664684 RepID=A0A7I8WEP6_9ANNE|nr:unnamed protein product [Dimorphilus gyrociliatus]